MNKRPIYNGYEVSPSDFERARTQIATPFQYIDFDLTNADTNEIINIAGDFLYVDAYSTGQATIELNNNYSDKEAPFLVQAGFAINATFKQLRMSWAAQPGKVLRILYSTGDRVVPANAGVTSATINNSILNSGNVNETGYQYSGSYKSMTAMAANTPDTIFTPASNINGAILWFADSYTAGSAIYNAIVAKNSAPTSVIDGDVLSEFNWPAVNQGIARVSRPIKIAAGKGVYAISSAAETAGFRKALYSLL